MPRTGLYARARFHDVGESQSGERGLLCRQSGGLAGVALLWAMARLLGHFWPRLGLVCGK